MTLNFLYILFIFLKFSNEYTISDKEYNDLVLNSKKYDKFLIELWDPWCHHCNQFRPIWQQFGKDYDTKDKFLIVDMNCLENAKLCRSLSNSGYPQILWLETKIKDDIQTVIYNGPLTSEGLSQFVEKQLNFPFILIKSEDEIQNQLNTIRSKSLFVFQYSKENIQQNYIDIIKNATYYFRSFDCLFVSYENEQIKEPQFYVFKNKTNKIYFKNNWNNEDLYQFILQNAFPNFSQFTGNLFDFITKKKQMIGLFFIDNKTKVFDDYETLANQFNDFVNSAYIKYSEKEHFSRLMSISYKELPCFVLFDSTNNRWIKYQNSIPNSENAFVNWIKTLDLNKIKWSGPGTGLFSKFWFELYRMKAENTGELIAVIISFVIVIIMIILYIYFVFCYEDENNKTNKSVKED